MLMNLLKKFMYTSQSLDEIRGNVKFAEELHRKLVNYLRINTNEDIKVFVCKRADSRVVYAKYNNYLAFMSDETCTESEASQVFEKVLKVEKNYQCKVITFNEKDYIMAFSKGCYEVIFASKSKT